MVSLVDTTGLDQFMDYMSQSNLNILDLRNDLLEAKVDNLLYQKTDSHWNHNGAFVAYKSIMNLLQEKGIDIKSPDKDSYTISEIPIEKGDLATMLGLSPFYNNTKFVYTPNDDVPKIKFQSTPAYDNNKLSYKLNYIATTGLKETPRLLVFNDSFVTYILRFLSTGFGRSAFYWTYDFNKDVINQEKPDIVISIMVERSLYKLIVKKE
ncbi:MAG: hypothetical protein IH948_00415 [Bacteroidetes bacterium]|nr:hypothetical protein [Bacteroidota bacterium]